MLDLYNTIILPYLNYGLLAWGNSFRNQVDKLLLIQKKAMRVICHKNKYDHTDQLFYSNKVLKIDDLFSLRLGCTMYQINAGHLPHSLNFHHYPTKQSSDYHFPRSRTLYKQKTLIYTGPAVWNSLDISFKQSPSISSFKHNFKLKQINRYKESI